MCIRDSDVSPRALMNRKATHMRPVPDSRDARSDEKINTLLGFVPKRPRRCAHFQVSQSSPAFAVRSPGKI